MQSRLCLADACGREWRTALDQPREKNNAYFHAIPRPADSEQEHEEVLAGEGPSRRTKCLRWGPKHKKRGKDDEEHSKKNKKKKKDHNHDEQSKNKSKNDSETKEMTTESPGQCQALPNAKSSSSALESDGHETSSEPTLDKHAPLYEAASAAPSIALTFVVTRCAPCKSYICKPHRLFFKACFRQTLWFQAQPRNNSEFGVGSQL